MKEKKKYYRLLACIVLLLFMLPQMVLAESLPHETDAEYGVIGYVYVDGLRVPTNYNSANYIFPDGRILVDLEIYSKFFGYVMDYNETTGQVIVSENGKEKWKLKVGSKDYYANGEKKAMNSVVVVYEQTEKTYKDVYVPLELFIDELQATIKLSGETEREWAKRAYGAKKPMVYQGIVMNAASRLDIYTVNREKEELWGEYNVDEWAKGMGAIIMKVNGDDSKNLYLKPGDIPKNKQIRNGYEIMLSSYGSENREDALSSLAWLAVEGHRIDFAMDSMYFKSLTKEQYNQIMAQAEGMDKYMIPYTMELADKWGDRGILCWDMFRLSHVACWSYHAGYITKGEALDIIELAANVVHDNFSSWDEAMENYMDGYAWWGRTDVSKENTNYKKRCALYEQIKASQSADNLYFDDSLFKKPVVARPQSILTCTLNGKDVSIAADDGKIYIDSNGRTMVPLRTLAEAMQFTVSWNAADKSITIVDGPKGIVVFRLDSPEYTIDGSSQTMDTVAVSVPPGRTHVPLRYVAESLGATVQAVQTSDGMRIEITTE